MDICAAIIMFFRATQYTETSYFVLNTGFHVGCSEIPRRQAALLEAAGERFPYKLFEFLSFWRTPDSEFGRLKRAEMFTRSCLTPAHGKTRGMIGPF